MSGVGFEGGFWEHVDALRSVLLRIALVMVVLGVCAFIAMPWIFDHFIMAPCSPDFPTYRLFDSVASATGFSELATTADFRVDIVSVELASQFFTHMSASGWCALIAGFPIVLYLLWGFISPALHEHEKSGARRAFLGGNALFYCGAAVGYFLVFPLALRFLSQYSLSEAIRPIVSLDSYMDNFFTLLLAMGITFELPLLAWLLGKAGLLDRSFFSRFRRHAIVALLIIAALITPTGDPFTLLIVFLPVYLLWEGAALLVPADKAADEEL